MSAVAETREALGTLGECVMSIYGIARSLECRDLGPTQLLPAIDDFRDQAEREWEAARVLVASVTSRAAGGPLAAPVALLGSEVERVIAEVNALLSGVGKLGARERLELERHIHRVGGELQACHRLLGVLDATLSPHPIQLSLSDLVRGRWGPRPAFVARRVELCVKMSCGARVLVDPLVAWATLERFVHSLPEEMTTLFAKMESVKNGPPVLQVGDIADLMRSSLMRCSVDVGPRLAVENEILDAIMAVRGWQSMQHEGQIHIAFDAAAA